jgi:midasin (ATPase involved in ribosome maturation)
MDYCVEPRSASDADLAGAIEIRPDTVSILGHVILPRKSAISVDLDFCPTRFALDMLEFLAVGVHMNESILLEGHDGIGKNKAIEFLARLVGANVTRFQVCQGSEKHFVASLEEARRSENWFVVDDVNVGEDVLFSHFKHFFDTHHRHGHLLPKESGFRLFATMCPPEDYPGRRPVPLWFTAKWAYKVLGTPTDVDQAEYMKWLFGTRDDLAARIVTVT